MPSPPPATTSGNTSAACHTRSTSAMRLASFILRPCRLCGGLFPSYISACRPSAHLESAMVGSAEFSAGSFLRGFTGGICSDRDRKGGSGGARAEAVAEPNSECMGSKHTGDSLVGEACRGRCGILATGTGRDVTGAMASFHRRRVGAAMPRPRPRT
eukprot:scaffold7578_cov31-Tisochrysis_lutea.AAC.1